MSVIPPLVVRKRLPEVQLPKRLIRAREGTMLSVSTPCSSSQLSHVTSPRDKENIRRQIVGLAAKSDSTEQGRDIPLVVLSQTNVLPNTQKQTDGQQSLNNVSEYDLVNRATGPKIFTKQHTQIYKETANFNRTNSSSLMANGAELHSGLSRPKTPKIKARSKTNPKVVRFRMDDGTARKSVKQNGMDCGTRGNTGSCDYEVRGSAVAVRKEGLKGLLSQTEDFAENERRQNSLQASLKLFRRRIKLNQDKFIQPRETTTEDYVIHTRSPLFDITDLHIHEGGSGSRPQSGDRSARVFNPIPNSKDNGVARVQEEIPASRPLSSDEHVRILRSALHNKHTGGNVTKLTDRQDHEENYKNIKCSYRLPENPNWGKEVSFKDVTDSIPSVKTYVLAEESIPHVKFNKNNIQNAVTLNMHNLHVHNSITRVSGQKVKVGDSEISFDPRFLDWLEDSVSNISLHKSSGFLCKDTVGSGTPSVKRRMTKT